ncbi:DNA starvation/stationary phase protection protein [Erythrobacter sp. SCSIO 43205]|uniref:Dps family protein n=1 Tax=Erythrobacter sp. SCSIO 43205 TaxID=2779361 RepID=UPI001CA94AA5|nr:DNA starvation/stationary phase protection protein [Erythrobacter sp. SCSIO 43205]UAB77802.1 DNA starvation/stationary phase protection protein [Erythrobacter sp. SCSIO 43205]
MLDPNNSQTTQMVSEINALLADHFALYVKTKNFHWHVKGPRFRDLHVLFDEQAIEIRDQIDDIGERARKIGGDTITSLGMITQHTQVKDEDNTDLTAEEMVVKLRDDNKAMVERLKSMKATAEAAGDNATDGMIDDWTDMAEERVWFLNSVLG